MFPSKLAQVMRQVLRGIERSGPYAPPFLWSPRAYEVTPAWTPAESTRQAAMARTEDAGERQEERALRAPQAA